MACRYNEVRVSIHLEAEDQQLRLFVAVDLSEEVREELGRLQDDLRRRDLSSLRWVRPGGIHLTLKFLGCLLYTSDAADEEDSLYLGGRSFFKPIH